jgi:hypothetical protein
MATITRTLVEQEKIHVIMTTHSPATVAVAPEESVFVMDPDEPGVRKSSKAKALAILTSEIPTLSISFDGRRQVFVESDTDAELYSLIYQRIRPSLPSERSLVFIGVGLRRPEGDRNAGCDQVKKVVGQLVEGGNASVFGLLDWDQTRNPDGRIHVLAQGERYAVENCLLDPLLLAATSVRERRAFGEFVDEDETFLSLREFGAQRLQVVAEKVQLRVLELDSTQQLGTLRCVEYLGGFSLQISERYLHMNGHQLEDAVMKALPHLNGLKKRQGDLLRHIVTNVAAEIPRFIPRAVADSFKALLDA